MPISIEHLNLWLYQILNVPDQASNGMMNYAILLLHMILFTLHAFILFFVGYAVASRN